MQEGKPIWTESLLTDKEYEEMSKKYPTTYSKGGKKISMYDCEFKWRFGMGACLNTEEIKLINSRMDFILKSAGINRK